MGNTLSIMICRDILVKVRGYIVTALGIDRDLEGGHLTFRATRPMLENESTPQSMDELVASTEESSASLNAL